MSAASKCPNCFKDIRENSKFCKYCGTQLKICPKCKDHNKIEDMFCGTCGEDIKDVKVESPINVKQLPKGQVVPQQSPTDGKQPQLVIWPPIDQNKVYQPPPVKTATIIPDGERYEPPAAKYDYNKVRPFGFFSGPIPVSNVISPAVESFGYALAFIAIGIVIASIGLAFYEYLIPPIITIILGGAFVLSAPFFGIYYVSSKWLYKIFQIKRPVKMSTIMLNYGLGTLLFSVLGLAFSPLLVLDLITDINPAIGITIFSVVAALIYLLGLFIIPLKAFLADLVYVKNAMNQRDKEEDTSEKEEKMKEMKEEKKKK